MFRGCFLREAALFGSVSEFHLFEADTGADFDRLLYTPLGGCGKMDGGKMEERVQNTISEEDWFRNKVYWLSFLFSLLVVWAHSLNGELFVTGEQELETVQQLEHLAASQLAQIAVPVFFMISAYLFYRNFQLNSLFSKWRSRSRTILLPYLLWNSLYYGAYAAATRIPAICQIIGKPPVPLTAGEFLKALLHYGYNPVFWYLFQLILLILLAPVLYVLLKKNVRGLLFLLFLILCLWKGVSFPWLNLDALFYYSAAAFFALRREQLGNYLERRPAESLKERWKHLFIQITILSFFFWLLQITDLPAAPLHGHPLHTVLTRLWGVCTAVCLIRIIPLPPAADLIKNSFFLYAVHFPWVRLLNKTAALILPSTPASALFMFILMPVFIIIITCIISSSMKKNFPGTYFVLSGGRGR